MPGVILRVHYYVVYRHTVGVRTARIAIGRFRIVVLDGSRGNLHRHFQNRIALHGLICVRIQLRWYFI